MSSTSILDFGFAAAVSSSDKIKKRSHTPDEPDELDEIVPRERRLTGRPIVKAEKSIQTAVKRQKGEPECECGGTHNVWKKEYSDTRYHWTEIQQCNGHVVKTRSRSGVVWNQGQPSEKVYFKLVDGEWIRRDVRKLPSRPNTTVFNV